jgi:hypothetical protein
MIPRKKSVRISIHGFSGGLKLLSIVIPGRRVRAEPGIHGYAAIQHMGSASAQQHFVSQRVRDDSGSGAREHVKESKQMAPHSAETKQRRQEDETREAKMFDCFMAEPVHSGTLRGARGKDSISGPSIPMFRPQ